MKQRLTAPLEPLVPFAGGSSVEGNFTAPYSGISVDFSQMNRIVAFHEEEYINQRWSYLDRSLTWHSMDVVVQPGVSWVDLNDAIKDSGLFLPLDPSPTVGFSMRCDGTTLIPSTRRSLEEWYPQTVGMCSCQCAVRGFCLPSQWNERSQVRHNEGLGLEPHGCSG